MPVPATNGSFRTNINEMEVGDYIACKYTATTSGIAGFFSDLGAPLATAQANEIPVAGTATPNGYFYLLKADEGLLIADRNVQYSISWDTLNAYRYAEGDVPITSLTTKAQMYHFALESASSLTTAGSTTNIGTFTGTPAVAQGWKGSALQFTGSQRILCNAPIFPVGAKTIQFRVKVPSKTAAASYILAQCSSSITQSGTYFYIDAATGYIVACYANSGNKIGLSSTASICDNAWHTITYTTAGTTAVDSAKLYVDGLLVMSGKPTETEVASTYNLTIGGLYGISSFIGYIDELEVYDYVVIPNIVPCKLRMPTGGNAYIDANGNSTLTDNNLGAWPPNNEWDTYIVNSTLNGKITAGDDIVWNKETRYSMCQDTLKSGIWTSYTNATATIDSTYRSGRGFSSDLSPSWKDVAGIGFAGTSTYIGFRPVLEYVANPKQTNLWY